MIEKMKFLSITGPKADIDRMTETYLSRYEIHLENALAELTEVANLSPFLEINPYKDHLNVIDSFYEQLETPEKAVISDMTVETALKTVQNELQIYPLSFRTYRKAVPPEIREIHLRQSGYSFYQMRRR